MASGKPYVFRPFHHDLVINLYRQLQSTFDKRQYSVLIGCVMVGVGYFILECKRLITTSAEPLCAQFNCLCITRFYSVSLIEDFTEWRLVLCYIDCKLYLSCLNNFDHLEKKKKEKEFRKSRCAGGTWWFVNTLLRLTYPLVHIFTTRSNLWKRYQVLILWRADCTVAVVLKCHVYLAKGRHGVLVLGIGLELVLGLITHVFKLGKHMFWCCCLCLVVLNTDFVQY